MANSEQRLSGVSSEAVAKATGRGWGQWLEFPDGLGAGEMTHKEIVALAAGPGGLGNGWWQQSVAVGYEQARGLRVVGQSSTADFQVGAQKTLPVSAEVAWSLLADGTGRDGTPGWARSMGCDLREGESTRLQKEYGARSDRRCRGNG